jgi:hypothetical protein
VHRYSTRLLTFLLLVLPAIAPAASAQSESAQPLRVEQTERGSELTVYLMTMGPGGMVWERFGHNAIWIRDDVRDTDIAYNYGMFSFEQDGFLMRFIRGHMDYWMEGFDAFLTASSYMRDDRSVWAQELNLTPSQRADLRDFLEWNSRPENMFYRYDYYRDNCSTRVRDAIDRVLGGQIRAQTEGIGAGTTYREHTASLTADDPIIYAGLMVGLGQPVDREISVWEEMFLPMMFREHVRGLTIDDGAGGRVPLVVSEQVLYAGSTADLPPEAPSRLPLFLVLGLALGGIIYGSARTAERGRGSRITFGIAGATWALVAGTLGLVLLGLWAFTDHATSYRNENLFFFTPLLLPLVGLIPLVASGSERARRLAFTLAAIVAVLSLAGVVLQLLPFFYQVNGELIALALPANLGLAAGCWEHTRNGAGRRETGPVPPRKRGGSRTARL